MKYVFASILFLGLASGCSNQTGGGGWVVGNSISGQDSPAVMSDSKKDAGCGCSAADQPCSCGGGETGDCGCDAPKPKTKKSSKKK